MGLQITTNQVTALAPDASSTSAGKKLANPKHWKNMGQSEEALWGECQGSALYQVRIAIATLTIQCSCPSRKQPCKHGLGLLLLVANNAQSVPVSEPPEWITSWMAKREATAKRKETRETQDQSASAEPTESQKKTAAKRQKQVDKGIEQLDLWLNDLVRNGLGSLETQPATFWEKQATQMVNAQAPGLATAIRRLATIPNASPQWPEKLLGELGKIALLTESYRRLDTLESALQEDIRQLIGWNLKEDEVLARGEHVKDEWLIIGQTVEDQERGRTQRTWLYGTNSGRSALILQFSFAQTPFTDNYPVGASLQAELAFWPGLAPQRALVAKRESSIRSWTARLPGTETIDAFLEECTNALARHPWRERFLFSLHNASPIYEASTDQWYIRDQTGQVLPLTRAEHWQLLALSGGQTLDMAGEWNGEALLPLAVTVDTTYHVLGVAS